MEVFLGKELMVPHHVLPLRQNQETSFEACFA